MTFLSSSRSSKSYSCVQNYISVLLKYFLDLLYQAIQTFPSLLGMKTRNVSKT